MAKYAINDTTLTALANKVRAKTGRTDKLTPDGGMLTALEELPDVTYPVADQPETMGQRACLARAAHLRDIELVPAADLVCRDNYTYPAGETVTGIPYSSTRKTDNFIGYNVSLHTFMTALHNPRSVLYTKQSTEHVAKTWYGLNCTVYVSYCFGLPYHSATAILPFMDCMEEVAVEDMRLCDTAVASTNNGGTVGHAVLITGIERNRDGSIAKITISHCTSYNTRTKRYTYEETMYYSTFCSLYIDQQGYKIFRYKDLWNTVYTPSAYVPQFDEPIGTVTYSDLCTDLGDKATLKTDESITLQPLVTDGYNSIVLYKDGEPISTHAVGDVALTNLAAGKYVAKMGDAETSFIVADVSVEKDGNRYTFAGDGVPMRVVFKDASGYTLRAVNLTEEDVLNGYVNIDYTNAAADHICVPFKNEYGFVVARCDYTVEETVDIPDEYQAVEYIETDGNQYIDTGVMASNHANGMDYELVGMVSGYKNASGNNYVFGALANSSRSGNVSFNTSSNHAVLYVGGGGTPILVGNLPSAGVKFTLTASASSADASVAKAALDGVAFKTSTATGTQTESTMPSANMHLFTANGVAATNGKYCGKLYRFTMTAADGTPIRNFVPCYRVADDVIGLYDTVGGVFYTNSGAGAFTKGAEI